MSPEQAKGYLDRYNRLLKGSDHIYRQVSQAFHLPEAALWILYFLRDEEVCTQRDLCERMFQSKQSINSAMKRLEAQGYIALSISAESRRRKRICLTAAGEGLARETADRIIAAEQAAFAALPQEDCSQMLTLYERFLAALKENMEHIERPEREENQ